MNIYKKLFTIILVNIILFTVVWFFTAYCFFVFSAHDDNNMPWHECIKKFYICKHFYKQKDCLDTALFHPETIKYKWNIPRKPVGLKYKTIPLLLLGCSYAYGESLNDNQIFSYKLSEIIKRPVYNKAVSGGGLQHSYYLTLQNIFYKQVPFCDTVIYIFIDDHFRRMLGEEFYIAEPVIYLNYKYENNNLILDDYNNSFFILCKKDYVLRAFHKLYDMFCLKHESDKLTDEALTFFIKIRENLENHWHKKVNFIVLYYEDFDNPYNNLKQALISKLKNNNFQVIMTSKLTDIDLYSEEYNPTEFNKHPNEKAWDLITPLFIEECKKRGLLK